MSKVTMEIKFTEPKPNPLLDQLMDYQQEIIAEIYRTFYVIASNQGVGAIYMHAKECGQLVLSNPQIFEQKKRV